ncbi:hypothetical protein C8J57DRAFT_1365252, partial [Mycena rebaudengoi]
MPVLATVFLMLASIPPLLRPPCAHERHPPSTAKLPASYQQFRPPRSPSERGCTTANMEYVVPRRFFLLVLLTLKHCCSGRVRHMDGGAEAPPKTRPAF